VATALVETARSRIDVWSISNPAFRYFLVSHIATQEAYMGCTAEQAALGNIADKAAKSGPVN
jgi:hypothetical protein